MLTTAPKLRLRLIGIAGLVVGSPSLRSRLSLILFEMGMASLTPFGILGVTSFCEVFLSRYSKNNLLITCCAD